MFAENVIILFEGACGVDFLSVSFLLSQAHPVRPKGNRCSCQMTKPLHPGSTTC